MSKERLDPFDYSEAEALIEKLREKFNRQYEEWLRKQEKGKR